MQSCSEHLIGNEIIIIIIIIIRRTDQGLLVTQPDLDWLRVAGEKRFYENCSSTYPTTIPDNSLKFNNAHQYTLSTMSFVTLRKSLPKFDGVSLIPSWSNHVSCRFRFHIRCRLCSATGNTDIGTKVTKVNGGLILNVLFNYKMTNLPTGFPGWLVVGWDLS